MPFKPGHKKMGGAKKGTDYRTKKSTAEEFLEAYGRDFMSVYIEHMQTHPKDKPDMLKALLPYVKSKMATQVIVENTAENQELRERASTAEQAYLELLAVKVERGGRENNS